MRPLPLALSLLITAAANAQTIASYKYDPFAIRTGSTTPSTLEVEVTGTPTSVRIDLLTGDTLNLTPSGANRWRVSVPAAQLLAGYGPNKVNHNFVGFVRVTGGPNGNITSTLNSSIQVFDGSVTIPPIVQKDPGARSSPRILNLYRPNLGVTDISSAVKGFYSYYKDDFDFVRVVFMLPSYARGIYSPYHMIVRNDVQGVGLLSMNETASYGSAGKLKGVTVYPVDNYIDCAESAFSHELGNQWMNYLRNQSLTAASPHWPASTMARGIMGMAIIPPTGAGGPFSYNLEMVTSTTAHVTQVSAGLLQEFTDLDLYLMGFLPAESVSPVIVVQWTVACRDCIMPASVMTIQDVIAANGPRVPDWKAAQKSFRIGTVVITRDRLLNDDEMAILEYFAARGESTQSLPYTSGLATGIAKPFSVATRGMGTVDLRLEQPPPKHRSAKH